MIKTFTRDDLIRYIYGETTKRETEEIAQAVLCDNDTHAEFNGLTDLKNQLDALREEPSGQVIQTILNYSRIFEMPHLTD